METNDRQSNVPQNLSFIDRIIRMAIGIAVISLLFSITRPLTYQQHGYHFWPFYRSIRS